MRAEKVAESELHDLSPESEQLNGINAIPRELPKLPTFPVDAMPRGCRALIREATAAIGCPPEFVALPMLVVLGTAIGNSRVLMLKPGWEEGAALYGAVVAAPGEKKTPALKIALEPATRTQTRLRKDFRREKDEYMRKMRQWEVDRRESTQNGNSAPPPPQEPRMERTVVEDTTVEALAVVLEGTPRGVAVFRDELSGWVRSMDQYKQGGRGAEPQAILVGDLRTVDLGFENQAFGVHEQMTLRIRAPSYPPRRNRVVLRLHRLSLRTGSPHYPRTGLGVSPQASSQALAQHTAFKRSKVPSMRHFLNQ